MKTYIGTYGRNHIMVQVEEHGARYPLKPQYKIRRHSNGFNWGYGGSGPAQLALALMCDIYGTPKREEQLRERHPIHYQDLKFAFVAGLEQGKDWRATENEIKDVVERLKAQRLAKDEERLHQERHDGEKRNAEGEQA